MDTLLFLQHYWWFLISLQGALLVFLLFVQCGQGLLYTMGRTEAERDLVVNALGRKWEFTFTTLVTFGGAFFASFPLFYSTSFGGAFYVWMAILLVFVVQAVSYEYRRKPSNVLGQRTYEAFLVLNGVAGPLLLGVAVGTFFTGAEFTVNRMNMAAVGGDTAISQWATPWHGLEALTDARNLLLGVAVFALSRVLAFHFFLNNLDDETLRLRARRLSCGYSLLFLAAFLAFFGWLLCSDGRAIDPASGTVSIEPTNTCTICWRCRLSLSCCSQASLRCCGDFGAAGATAAGGRSGSAARERSSRCWHCCCWRAGTIPATTRR